MITVKQVLENYDILTEKSDNDSKNLVALVHAGLLDESQLPILRRAMSKPAINMTEAEKKALHGLVESVSSCIISEKQDHLSKLDTSRSMGYPPEKDIPAVIILKRKAIRVYPDNQKVALYYSQALDRYISIPYGKNSKALDMTLNEEAKPRDFKRLLQIYARRQGKSPEELSATKIGELAGKSGQSRLDALSVARKAMGAEDNPKEGFQKGYRSGVDALARRGLKSTADQKVPERPSKYEPTNQKSTSSVPEVQGPTQFGKPPIKELFRKKLEEKRQEKQLDEEGDWKSLIPGVDAYRAAKEGRYLDAAGNLALDVGTVAAGVATGGLGAAAIRGGIAAAKAAKYAKAGNKLSTALQAAKKGASRSTGWKIAKKIGKGVVGAGKLAAGTAGTLAAGAKAAADSITKDELATPLDSDSYKFTGGTSKAAQTQVGTPGESGQIQARRNLIAYRNPSTAMSFATESNNLNILKQMVEHNISSHVIHINETPITINNRVAKKVVNVYESLNRQNKKKVEKMLNEDATSFKKIINFAVRQ